MDSSTSEKEINANSRVQRDEHGVYIKKFKQVYRPGKSTSDSVFKSGEIVKTDGNGGRILLIESRLTLKSNTKRMGSWQSHGFYIRDDAGRIKSSDVFIEKGFTNYSESGEFN